MTESFLPRHMVITTHPKLPDAIREAAAIAEYLKQKGIEVPYGSLNDEHLRRRIRDGEFDMLVAVGGDGTVLRAGQLCAPCDVPILGVNQGRLGFLFQVEPGGWRGMIEMLLRGEAWIERRMMLRAVHVRSGESLGAWHALNDVVVARGGYLRPVQVAVSVDGQLLTTFVADGVIASTATGSTAYALAAGGPILPPELRNILLVPIAPHLSVDRAVVLSEGSSVSMTIHSENGALSLDGQLPVSLAEEDRVDVRAGDYDVKFVRFGDPGYFYRNLTAHMNQNRSIVGLPR
jgi:NAD+ kinase